jgi:hypothetical protein
VSYGYQKLDRLLNQDFWAELTILYKSSFWQTFAITLLETLYTKDVANKPSFLLVNHMTSFDIKINRYEFFNSGFAAEQILDRLTIQAFD